MSAPRYPRFTGGDLNAFFGLTLDNLTNLVILSGILAMGFGFPAEFIFARMVPGTALGVMVGDLVYTWMAFRLARRTGRNDVTAMPLGLDTPSTIGIAVAVLGPTYVATKDPVVTWQVGMATMVMIGVLKVVLSFAGDWVRRIVPQAGLLGSIGGVGVALLGLVPLIEIFKLPVVGLVALGLVLYTLVAKLQVPGKLPGAAVAVLVGALVYYGMGLLGLISAPLPEPSLSFTPPVPTLGFIEGMHLAVYYLPLAIPFGLLTVVGGINVTESAQAAGDNYRTRDILLTEAAATLVAGLCGGVAQSTPYIGHPAYKAMGGRAGYTLATGLFVGLGGMLGYVSFIVKLLPAAAVAPILIFVGLEIASQTFVVCPRRHYAAVVFAFLPTVANLLMFKTTGLLAGLGWPILSAELAAERGAVVALGNGFILTAMLWGAFGAHLADRKLLQAAAFVGICALFTLFGVIHSVEPSGRLYLPWEVANSAPFHMAAGYALFGLLLVLFHFFGARATEQELAEERS